MAALAALICDLQAKNLLQAKILTLLPERFVRNSLCPASCQFNRIFARELDLLGEGSAPYLATVDALFDPFVRIFSESDLSPTRESSEAASQSELLGQLRGKLRIFFTQDVLLHKWDSLNWVFVRRCIERALAYPPSVSEPLLREIFDEVTKPGTGMAAMDFGYAFDSLIWVSNLFRDF